jgi:serine/threonine protein phosphatase PrpC
LDELLDTDKGKEELRKLAGVSAESGVHDLFSKVADSLDDEKPLPVDKEESDGVENLRSNPSGKRLQRVDSSETFRRSALERHSVIPTDREVAGESLESFVVGNQVEDEESLNEVHASGMGCTALSALIHGNKVIIANTGDARCIKSNGGEATPLSLDHKPILYEEARRIINAGGYVHNNRVNGELNVSRTIGDLKYKRNINLPHTEQMVVATPDITEFEVQEGDEFLILACDGIWDVLSNQEAVDFVRSRLKQGMSLKLICEAMCDHCLAPDLKGLCRGADNMSVIVVVFKKNFMMGSMWNRWWTRTMGLFKRNF